MKICLVSAGYPPDDFGGIGTYTANLAESLVERGHAVYVLTDPREGRAAVETRNGVVIKRVTLTQLPKVEDYLPGIASSVSLARKIRELDREVGLDVIEFPNWEGPGLAYLKMPRRKPVVVRAHTPFFETLSIDKAGQSVRFPDRVVCWQEKTACLGADMLVASTRFHANMIEQEYGMRSGTIRILPLGIDISAFDGKKRERGTEPFRILYVSRLEKRKGTQALLDAIPKVLATHPDTEFVLVGSDRKHAEGGKTHAEYFRAKHPELNDKVKFLGIVPADDLTSWYRNSDLFVVPSLYESFGLIYLEAMAAGLALVGGRGGGIPEVVADGETGFLVDANDGDVLLMRINELITNATLRAEMGVAGRARVEQKFSRQIMAQNTEQAYTDAIEKHRRSR